jgi:hypothetical protein
MGEYWLYGGGVDLYNNGKPDTKRPAFGPFMPPLPLKVQFQVTPFPYSRHPLSGISNSEPTA